MPQGRGTRALPPSERPRERCLRLGPEHLSDIELVALLLGTGRAGEDVQDLAKRLIAAFGSLQGLAAASAAEVRAVKGLGPARAALLQAAFEAGRRQVGAAPEGRPLATPEAAARILAPWLARAKQERFLVLCLDAKRRLLKQEEVSRGTLTTSLVHPREVFALAIRERAASILVAHNHPSGDLTPSDDDLAVTQRLAEAGRLVGIPLDDHLILGRAGFLSLRREGFLDP